MTPDHKVAESPTAHSRRLWTGLALVTVAAVAYGITPAIVALGRGTVSLFDLLTYRAVFASAALALIALLGGHGRSLVAARPWRGVLIGATFLSADVLLFFGSLNYLATSLAVAIGFLYPTVVLLLMSAYSRRPPRGSDVLLSLLAVAGVAAMTLSSGVAEVKPLGLVMVLGCTLVYSSYVLFASRLTRDTPPFAIAVQVQFGVALSVGSLGLATGHLTALETPQAWRQVLVQSVILAVAMTAYFAGLSRLGPGLASTGDTVQPAVALVAGGVLLGESVTPFKVVGVVMVILAIAIASTRERRRVGASITGSP